MKERRNGLRFGSALLSFWQHLTAAHSHERRSKKDHPHEVVRASSERALFQRARIPNAATHDSSAIQWRPLNAQEEHVEEEIEAEARREEEEVCQQPPQLDDKQVSTSTGRIQRQT